MKLTTLLFIIIINLPLFGQSEFATNPDDAVLVTEDINRFWQAFDQVQAGAAGNPFEAYLDQGSEGVRDFIPYRIQSAENLLNHVKANKEKYENTRDISLQMKTKEKEIKAAFSAFKDWYPDARFPPIYFVIGVFNSGGTSSDHGLIIGAETQSSVENIPSLVAHELIHFQQKGFSKPTLLEQSIHEGSADFLGELISGGHINQTAFEYGNQNEATLCKEFVKAMNKRKTAGWLYGPKKKGRPNDLGYWMGYQITAKYFEQAEDKRQAIKDIINMSDAHSFLDRSGYLKAYIK